MRIKQKVAEAEPGSPKGCRALDVRGKRHKYANISKCHRYRSDIDGLRGIAVLTVVLFHARVPGFQGGYIGVDVFFVISGFLITSILFEYGGQERGLFWFYERRIRANISPPYLLCLSAVQRLALSFCCQTIWFASVPVWWPPRCLEQIFFSGSKLVISLLYPNLSHFCICRVARGRRAILRFLPSCLGGHQKIFQCIHDESNGCRDLAFLRAECLGGELRSDLVYELS